MKTLKLVITLFAIFTCKMVTAHALWIETTAIGSKDKDQEVKIYYGEYSHNLIEPVDKWYSDVKGFKLFLISPSQQKTEIKTTAHSDYFSASFNPTEEGTYILAIEHPAKDPYQTTAFEFTAMAKVQVGRQSETVAALALSIHIEPKDYHVGDMIQAQIKRNDVLFPNAEVEVVMPGGWVKSLKTDEKGILSFKTPAGGKYLLEVTDTEEKKANWFGKSIDKVWRANTAVLFVN